MARIGSKNTRPELQLRKALFAAGFRYRLHRKDLPGSPDLYLPKFKAVIFVNGCFWHGHGCKNSKIPKSNTEFWRRKIESNRERDQRTNDALTGLGIKPITIWECQLRGRHHEEIHELVGQISKLLTEVHAAR